MKFTAKYKDGALILDRAITPRGETLHIEIPDEEVVVSRKRKPGGESAVFAEEEEKIRKLMEEEPFLRELWKDLPPRPARAHGKSDRELLEEAISENPKYFPES